MMDGYGFGGCLNRFAGPNGSLGQGWFGGGFIMMLSLLLLIGFVLYMVMRPNSRNFYQAGTVNNTNSALEILKMRYAKGEISDAEFADKRERLL